MGPVSASPARVRTAPSATVRVATRSSALALTQSRLVGEQVAQAAGLALALVEVTTRGDVDDAPLSRIGGTGVFVAAVRAAVLDGRADLAVHSLKDLPTAPAHGLRLAAVPPREDPRDALVSRDGSTLAQLAPGARVGTGSPRRRVQLLALRPDLEVVDLRGNVDTRLARVLGDRDRPADLDAVILAAAGLARLGRADVISERLDPAVMLPAPGQGALAVEVLADPGATFGHPGTRGRPDRPDESPGAPEGPDPMTGSASADRPDDLGRTVDAGASRDRRDDSGAALAAALAAVDHAPTRAAVTAERALLAALGAGCSAPVGAWADLDLAVGHPTVHLHAVLATASGALVRRTRSGVPDQATELGRQLAAELLTEAADDAGPSRGTLRPPHQGSHL
jgi:hydroxymethylbilane synthase